MNKTISALEAFKLQDKSFREDFLKVIVSLREQIKTKSSGYDLTELMAWIKKKTNLNIHFYISSRFECIYPALTTNHPLYPMADTAKLVNMSSLEDFIRKQNKRILEASVDEEKMWVSGDYAKVLFKIGLDYGVLRDINLDDGFVSACVLHEIGHVITWCKYLHMEVSDNMILSACMRSLSLPGGYSNKKRIVDLAVKNSRVKGFKIDDIENMSVDQIMVSLATISNHEKRSNSGSKEYDATALEAVADQFVVRCGFAVEMAKARDYYNRKGKTHGLRSRWDFIKADLLANKYIMTFLAFSMVSGTVGMALRHVEDENILIGVIRGMNLGLGQSESKSIFDVMVNAITFLPKTIYQSAKRLTLNVADLLSGNFFNREIFAIDAAGNMVKQEGLFEALAKVAHIAMLVSSLGYLILSFKKIIIEPADRIANESGLDQRYDRDIVGIKRIREDLINILKDKTISKERKDQLIIEIAAIDEIIDQYHEYQSIYEPIIRYFKLGPSWVSSRKEQEDLQRELEELNANDLHILAHQFQSF